LDSRPNVFAVLSTVVFMFIITACQSTTEKTVDQTLSDASISTAVQAKLTSDRVSQFLHVNVTTERGIVTLSGMVATKAQRGQAERLARQVKGVLKVKNILQIKNHPTAAGKPVPPNHLPDTKGPPLQGVRTIQGEVVRVDGENYIVKSDDGREVQFQADMMTRRLETIQSGDRIEADVDDDNYAALLLLSQRPNTPGK